MRRKMASSEMEQVGMRPRREKTQGARGKARKSVQHRSFLDPFGEVAQFRTLAIP